MTFFLFFLFMLSVEGAVHNESWVVKTRQGLLRGFKDKNQNFYSFFGIPYATTPIGEERFKAPLPPASWSGIMNATTRNVVCPQRQRRHEDLIYQEDCLKMNIFVPHDRPGVVSKLPVIVHIHGGGFISDGDHGGPDNLVRHGVIVVTFQYRVGILGFLCLGTKDAPGNAGIKDQLAALRWVKDNINRFGGDPDNITAYGTNAGAACLDTLVIANKTAGLVERVILESGSAFKEFQEEGKQQALYVARKLGYKGSKLVKDILQFYRKASAKSLGTAPMEDLIPHLRVGPCIESFSSNTSIITKSPIQCVQKGDYTKIPYMIGFTSLEGSQYAPLFSTIEKLLGNLTKLVEFTQASSNQREKEKALERMRKAYFGKAKIRLDERYIEFCSEFFSEYPILVSAFYNAIKRGSPVHMFKFSYDGGMGVPRNDFKHLIGGRQGDIWAYAFTHGVKSNTTEDQTTIDRMTTLITNFAKYGNPNQLKSKLLPVVWPPLTEKPREYLDIGADLKIKSDLPSSRHKILDQVFGFQAFSSVSRNYCGPLQSFINLLIIICAKLGFQCLTL